MNLESIIKRRNSRKIPRITSHILFWILVFSSSYFLIITSLDSYKETPLSYLSPLRSTLGLMLFFYPLMYVIIPRFLKKKRLLYFVISFAILLFIYILFEAVGEKMTFHFCDSCNAKALENNPDYLSVIKKAVLDNFLFKSSSIGLYFNLFSGLLLPIAIKSSLGYYDVYIKNLELEKEKVQLELNFLKAQVNPHFLFNTLNNLYGLILNKSTDASAETVTLLSDYLRYSLENAHKKSILLSNEITLIHNYIALEKLRLNHTEVVFTSNVENSNLSLPPLLFIPLIENAFKYNIDKKDTFLTIDLSLTENNLQIEIQNSFDEHRNHNNNGGLGLSNLKKRLDLYYENNYKYSVENDNSVYKVSLNLILK